MIFPSSRKAFTLVEALIAVSIVAFLVLISVSVVSTISSKAGQVRCLNNLRLVTSAITAFQVENRGRYLNTYKVEIEESPTGLAYHVTFWAGRLFHQGYLSDPNVFFCPSAKVKYWKEPSFAEGLRFNQGDSTWSYISYAGNRYGVMPGYSDGLVPARRADITNPAGTILLIESSNPEDIRNYDGIEWLSSASAAGVGAIIREGGTTSAAGPSRRHGRSVNVAFVDGHVEMMDLANSPISSFQSFNSEPWYEFVHTLPNP